MLGILDFIRVLKANLEFLDKFTRNSRFLNILAHHSLCPATKNRYKHAKY